MEKPLLSTALLIVQLQRRLTVDDAFMIREKECGFGNEKGHLGSQLLPQLKMLQKGLMALVSLPLSQVNFFLNPKRSDHLKASIREKFFI